MSTGFTGFTVQKFVDELAECEFLFEHLGQVYGAAEVLSFHLERM